MAIGDAEILGRVMQGDGEAFAVLFRKYGRLVHALALARTTRRAAAAELVRKTFTRAHAELERIPPGGTFRGFLLDVLQKEAAAYQKDHGRSLQLLRVGKEEVRRVGASLELRWVFRHLKGEDAALLLLEILGRLPPQYEDPFLLRHLEGMEPDAIAEATGLTPAEVGTALDSGRRLFERELKHAVEAAG